MNELILLTFLSQVFFRNECKHKKWINLYAKLNYSSSLLSTIWTGYLSRLSENISKYKEEY